MMKITPKNHPQGMTLVEILFAFAIIGSIITISYSSAIRGWRSAQVANQRTQAQVVAQNTIEKVKAFRDLNIITPPQPSQPYMRWSSNKNVHPTTGAGGFLQNIGMTTGSPPPIDTPQFAVEKCVAGDDCFWKVTGGDTGTTPSAETAIGDSTAYAVGIKVNSVTCSGSPPSPNCSLPDVVAIEIVARVTYTDALGIVSNAEANTILTKSEYN